MTQSHADAGALVGEGDLQIFVKQRYRRECEVCGEPATKRLAYCWENGRRNPASSMYGRDDCTYCCDLERFACDAHARDMQWGAPSGMDWGGTFTANDRFAHMFLYWIERAATPDDARALLAPTEVRHGD